MSRTKGFKHSKETIDKIRLAHKGKILTEEHKKKISLSNKGNPAHRYWLGKKMSIDFREKCKKNMTGKIHSEISKQKIREARMRQRFPNKNTSIELKLFNELMIRGISFEKHKPLTFTQPDAFIEPNICIYADGNYWHSIEKAKKQDAKINQELPKQGFIVLRYSETEINANIEGCVDEIEDILYLNRGEHYDFI